MVFAQIGNLIGRRYETRSGLDRGLFRNPLFVIGIALELAFAVAVLYWPPLGRASGPGPSRRGSWASRRSGRRSCSSRIWRASA